MQPKGPSLGDRFRTFLTNLNIDKQAFIVSEAKEITKEFNQKYWISRSDTKNVHFIGSYGRGTAIKGVKNINLLAVLPRDMYERYDRMRDNGQKAMLYEVRDSLLKAYPQAHINEEGHLLIPFSELTFEFIPTFLTTRKNYIYPDINEGGSWIAFNPIREIQVVDEMNYNYNGKIKHLARMMRAWKAVHDVPISGMLLDTLTLNFMEEWENKDKSFAYYGLMTLDFFEYLASRRREQLHWYAKGSNRILPSNDDFGANANVAYETVRKAFALEEEEERGEANKLWREVFGPDFPA